MNVHAPMISISQEGLKILACVTMLIDHIGAVFFPQLRWLRILGRMSFPIYCFLLAEGVHYTRSPLKYGLRLLFVALLAEIPYDLLFYGQFTWTRNSVMMTLLLGFCAGIAANHCSDWLKLPATLPFILLGRYCSGTYGMYGVAMIVMFSLTRDFPYRKAVQFVLMILLSLRMAGFPTHVGIQFYAFAAMVPISLYTGEKRSRSSTLQWSFNLFYPMHMLILLLIREL